MNKIPTAEEFAKTHHPMKTYPVDYQMMIEFAKLHCEAQAKVISENVKTKEVDGGYQGGGTSITIVDKESILNAYPLTNIK